MEIVLSIILYVLILAFALLVLSRTWIFIGRMTINEIRNIRARLYIKISSILKRQTELILSIGPCIYFKAIGRILCIIIKARICREQIHKTILLVGDGYFHPAPLLRTARSMGITLHAIVSDQMSYQ